MTLPVAPPDAQYRAYWTAIARKTIGWVTLGGLLLLGLGYWVVRMAVADGLADFYGHVGR